MSSSLWEVVICKGAATSLNPSVDVFVFDCLRLCLRLRPSPSSSISIVVPSGKASAVCAMFYIEGLETTVACVSTVYAVLRKVGFPTTGELVVKSPLLCCDVLP